MDTKLKGILLAAFGGSMWGLSGVVAQVLFNRYSASTEWLVSTRLLSAGILILLYSSMVKKDNIFAIIRNSKDLIQLALFSIFGMVGVQYLFFKTIEVSSASVATILQFTAPLFVYFYMLLRGEKHLKVQELFLVFTTFFGVLLIVTSGNFTQMSVSPLGFLLGIGSAIAVVFYTLQPRNLLTKYGPPMIVGWGMLIGGILFQFIHPFWQPGFKMTGQSYLLLAVIVLFGTAFSFISYLASLNYIEASLASIMTALEPLLAAVFSVFVFKQIFGLYEIMGIIIVLVSVLILSNLGNHKNLKQVAVKEIERDSIR
ncbi:DMT family transporter [Carnobacterium antarcticum]|uniref:DMT family transporter n=1 Tax=Carnobacterium antarcticum TaxID=2126436 RepID=A0ABW4NLB2_9LACT|nr:DMT family transporter [Carnobacterium sp. CP1]ALV21473.1 Permease of the drug/metabolite transporter [Carnobacterium sp. CP1]